jgi:hypothetical protein
VGWQKVQLTIAAQDAEVTACSLEMAKQEFDTVGGFRNRYSMDFPDPELRFHSDGAWFTLIDHVSSQNS